MTWSHGQELALEQLREISSLSGEALTLEKVTPPPDGNTRAQVEISISTSHVTRAKGGLPLRGRERLIIHITQNFPLEPPAVYSVHTRFADFPHVQWGSYICIYRSREIEWVPSDGMFGFIQRLNDWIKAAALGELDPDNAPLHPPTVYASSSERIITRENAPEIPDDDLHWIGAAHLKKIRKRRLDLTGWTSLDDGLPALDDDHVSAACVLLKQSLPMEYPERVFDLLMAMKERDMPFSLLSKLMQLYALSQNDGDPLYMVIGAPMRRPQAGGAMKQHLAVWQVEPDAATNLRKSLNETEEGEAAHDAFIKWAASARITWCRVYEDRPEVVERRDTGSSAEWLYGKSVLLLGCGALGSFVGEYVTRAGAGKLTLVDNDVVSPGVLVRQQFDDNDIAYTKCSALKVRLDRIKQHTEVLSECYDLKHGVFSKFVPGEFDLVIDATASHTVSHVLENELISLANSPPVVGLSVSARAEYGLAIVRQTSFPGGPIDLARRAKLKSLATQETKVFASAFWPKREDISLFQPEPGCSDPTFVGSAIDMAFHSSALMMIILDRLSTLKENQASADFVSKPGISPVLAPAVSSFIFSNVNIAVEKRYDYQVLTTKSANQQLTEQITKNAQERAPGIETGGLMFGEIDESIKTIWLDKVTGPPPDSEASEEKFLCGIEGTSELAVEHKKRTCGSSTFIGIWHTHPVSQPAPSEDDLNAMAELLLYQENPPRHIVMLIIGHAATSPKHAYYLYQRSEFMRVVNAYENQLDQNHE